MSKKTDRRARIQAVEDNPRHNRDWDPARADRETRSDDLGNPANHGPDKPKVKGTKVRSGVFSHPDWDD